MARWVRVCPLVCGGWSPCQGWGEGHFLATGTTGLAGVAAAFFFSRPSQPCPSRVTDPTMSRRYRSQPGSGVGAKSAGKKKSPALDSQPQPRAQLSWGANLPVQKNDNKWRLSTLNGGRARGPFFH